MTGLLGVGSLGDALTSGRAVAGGALGEGIATRRAGDDSPDPPAFGGIFGGPERPNPPLPLPLALFGCFAKERTISQQNETNKQNKRGVPALGGIVGGVAPPRPFHY